MNSKRILLASLLAAPLFLPASLHAAGCCQGQGDFGLDGAWKATDAKDKGPKTVTFVHASFESSRPLFADLNQEFAKQWAKQTGYKLTVTGSHGGTEAQARSIHHGAEPDVVSLDNPGALDELARTTQLLPSSWRSRLPQNSAPYTTTVVFVVEKGNPKGIRDWGDLVADGVKVITPDPRKSGRGQWNYLAAWGYARNHLGSEQAAQDFVTKLYERVPVLNSSATGSAETFTKRGEGDVLILWESDAYALVKEGGSRRFEVVTPSASILVEPPVAWLDANVGKHENARVSISFAKFLYTPEAQAIIARHYFRPRLPEAAAKSKIRLPEARVFTVDELFGGWEGAVKRHFSSGQAVDQVLRTSGLIPSAQLHVASN